MGETGRERGRALDGRPRERQDAFALDSQRKAIAAIEAGRFDDQIVPITVPPEKGEPAVVTRDEHPRADTSSEALAQAAAGVPGGRYGDRRQQLGDQRRRVGGAARRGRRRPRASGSEPLARVVSTAVAGVDPAVMGIGPVPATRKALDRAGIGVADLDLVELNEAFASQSLVCIDELGLDPGEGQRQRRRDRPRPSARA